MHIKRNLISIPHRCSATHLIAIKTLMTEWESFLWPHVEENVLPLSFYKNMRNLRFFIWSHIGVVTSDRVKKYQITAKNHEFFYQNFWKCSAFYHLKNGTKFIYIAWKHKELQTKMCQLPIFLRQTSVFFIYIFSKAMQV